MQKIILIVEDDADLRISLRKILIVNNFKVLEAADGAQALERVEKEHPDLVLLDFGLPVVSGESVCVKIKENYPEIVVIALTEKSLKSEVVQGLQIGADDYITKPFVAEELIARIDARLKKIPNKIVSIASNQTENKLILKESVAMIALRLVVAELIFGIIFILSSALFSFVETYFQITNTIAINLFASTIIFIINIGVATFIILKWKSEYSELTKNSLIRHSGIFFRKEQKYACNFIEVITLEQSMLGMIFNYGTIELYDPAIKEQIYLMNISNPKKYREIIEKSVSKNKKTPMPFIA